MPATLAPPPSRRSSPTPVSRSVPFRSSPPPARNSSVGFTRPTVRPSPPPSIPQYQPQPYASPSRSASRYADQARAASDAARVNDWQQNPRANGISQTPNRLPRTRPFPTTSTPTVRSPIAGGAGSTAAAALLAEQYARDKANARASFGDGAINSTAKNLGVTPEEYKAMSPEERTKRIDDYNKKYWNESPFNPFGEKWKGAPWNKKDTRNSLKPTPKKDTFNPNPAPGEYPFDNVPTNPITLTIKVPQYQRFLKNSATSISPWDFDGNYTKTVTGIPVSIVVEAWGGVGVGVYLVHKPSINAATARTSITQHILLDAVPSGTGLVKSQPPYSLINGPEIPSSLGAKEPIELPFPEVPAIDPETWPGELIEPTNRPEVPLPTFPFPPPRPQPKIAPGRKPALAPAPEPDTPIPQPQPIPQPAPDPLAPIQPAPYPGPSPDPLPRPTPGTAPGPLQAPAPSPGIKPGKKPEPSSGTNTGTTNKPSPQRQPVPLPWAQPQTQPQTQPEKPAPDFDPCKDPCIKDMHDTTKGQKPTEITYKSFVKCGENGAQFENKTMSVPGDQAAAIKALLDDAADRKAEKCDRTEATTMTIPEWWAVRPGADRPQFAIMFGEIFGTGKLGKSRWQLTIPHYNRPKGAKPAIPKYRKGNWQGTLTLTDNSKIRINAATSSEAKRVMNKLKILVPVQYRTINGKAIKPTILERVDGNMKECDVTPIRGDYYKTGQRQNVPDWSVDFR